MHPGGHERRAFRRAARVGVLDDNAAGAAQGAGQGRDRGCVEDVVVAQSLALERWLARCERAAGDGTRAPVPSRRLVRVIAVTQGLDLLEADRQGGRIRVRCAGQAGLVRERHPGGHHPHRENLNKITHLHVASHSPHW